MDKISWYKHDDCKNLYANIRNIQINKKNIFAAKECIWLLVEWMKIQIDKKWVIIEIDIPVKYYEVDIWNKIIATY